MGSCLSSSEIACASSTAKVITINGTLIEYSNATMVSDVLDTNHGTEAFLSSSDELDFDMPIPALPHQGWLELDQIYFILPMVMLHEPLSAQDMVTLAAKASLALAGRVIENRSRWSTKRTVQVVPVRETVEHERSISIGSTYSRNAKINSDKETPFRSRRSIARLSIIVE